jgi:hypothetical protein
MSNETGRAFAAPDNGINSHLFTGNKILYFSSHQLNHSGHLMTRDKWYRRSSLEVSVEHVHVASTDAGEFNSYQHFIDVNFRQC